MVRRIFKLENWTWGERDEPQLPENGKTQVKTFNEVEKIPDKIQIKLNFLKTPQTLFNIPKLSINYHKFSLSLLPWRILFYQNTWELCL